MCLKVITPDVKLDRKRGRMRKTVEPVHVVYRGHEIIVPAGFEFDGASIPFFLWWWVSPWRSWVVLAACVHDYCYRHNMMTRRDCDRLFLHLLCYSADKSRFRFVRYRRKVQARIMYRAVRQFGDNAAGEDW